MAEKKVTTADIKKEYAEKSKKNRVNGGKDVEISLTDTINARFIKDFGLMKEGKEQKLSVLSYEFYNRNKAVEKIN